MLATGSNQAARDVESGSPPSLVAAAASLPDRWRERFCVAVASDRDCAFRPAACRGPSVDWSFEAVGWKIGDRPFVPSARCRANAALTLGIPQGTNVFRGVQGCNQMASFGFLGPRCRCTKLPAIPRMVPAITWASMGGGARPEPEGGPSRLVATAAERLNILKGDRP
jgi:hypothetical protein